MKQVFKDCSKCEHYQPVTKGLFECARNFPPECCLPDETKKDRPMKEEKKKSLDDMSIWTFIVGLMLGFATATIVFECIAPLLKG